MNIPDWITGIFLVTWALVCSLLITVGIVLFSTRDETELARAMGGGLLMVGVLSAGSFLLFIAEHKM